MPIETAYKALAKSLRNDLLQDRYSDGRPLPTEAALAAEFAVSRQTVRRAFHELVSDGMVYRVPGRGTFAAPKDGKYLRQFGSIEDLMALSVDTELEVIAPLAVSRNPEAADELGLQDDSVATVKFVRRHDGEIFCVTDVHVEPATGAQLASSSDLVTAGRRSRITIIGSLDEVLDSPISEADQRISATAATSELADVLGCPEGDPLLKIERTYFDADGAAREFAVSYFLPQHYTYRLKLRRTLR